jgi:hypothetical protein
VGSCEGGDDEKVGPLKLVFRLEALADIDRESSFYASKDDDGRLVARFLNPVDEAVQKAARNSQT